jgi:hypothetical protein
VHARQARDGAPAREFAPVLLDEMPREAAAYLGVSGFAALAGVVPEAARETLGQTVESAGLDLDRDLLGPLRGEVALSVTPGDPVPTATLVAATTDEARTREALARLQQPMAELLGPPAAGALTGAFEQRTLGEVPAFSLPVTTGFELTYAIAAGRLIVSSTANGVGHVLAERPSLRTSPDFRRAVGELPPRAEAVVFLDLGQLLALVEQAGSSGDPAIAALRYDLRRIRVAGAVVRREETDSTAELFFEIP